MKGKDYYKHHDYLSNAKGRAGFAVVAFFGFVAIAVIYYILTLIYPAVSLP